MRRWYLYLLLAALAVLSEEFWSKKTPVHAFQALSFLRWRLDDGRLLGLDDGVRAPPPIAAIESKRDDIAAEMSESLLRESQSGSGEESELRSLDPAAQVRLNGSGDGRTVEVVGLGFTAEEALRVSRAAAASAEHVLSAWWERETEKRLEALRSLAARLEASWQEALDRKAELSKESGIADLDQHDQVLQRLFLDLAAEMQKVETRRWEILGVLEGRGVSPMGVAPDPGGAAPSLAFDRVSGSASATSSVQAMREELRRAKRDLAIRSEYLPDDHPRVAPLRERIWQIESLIHDAGARTASRSPSANVSPTPEDLVEEYRLLTLRLEGLRRQQDQLVQDRRRAKQWLPAYRALEERAARAHDEAAAAGERIRDLEWELAEGVNAIQIESLATAAVRKGPASATWAREAGAIGLALALAWLLARILDAVDTRIRRDRDVETHLKLPLLAVVPKLPRAVRLRPQALGAGAAVESLNAAASIIHSVGKEAGLKTLAVSSAGAGEGKTTVAIQLAAALARKGLKVLLLEGDFRHSQLQQLLALRNVLGLSQYLEKASPEQPEASAAAAAASALENLQFGDLIQETEVENLLAIHAGPPSDQPIRLIEGPALKRLVAELGRSFDYIVIDTPAVLEAGEALELVTLADACVFVVGSGQCESRDAAWAKHLLENVQASILGVILNRSSRSAALSTLHARARHDEERKLLLSYQ
jgi:capsular exopolysaccharide synthesis family protein